MRKIIALLLTFAMALSLVVIAGATETGNGSVSLKTKETVNGNEVTYTFTLDASKSKGVGALEFYVKPTNLTFKERTFPDGEKLEAVFMAGVAAGEGLNGTADFKGDQNYFIAYGGNAAKGRVLKGTVDLVSVTYTINNSNYSLEVTGFKACLSGEQAALKDTRYDCVAEPVDGGSSGVTVTPQCDALKDAYTVNGQTVTVTYSATCRVGYLQDGKYVTVSATQNGNAYDYIIPEGVTDVIVVVKGDTDGNGRVTNRDATLLRGIVLQKETATLSATESFAVDADGNGRITNRDATLIRGAALTRETLPQD